MNIQNELSRQRKIISFYSNREMVEIYNINIIIYFHNWSPDVIYYLGKKRFVFHNSFIFAYSHGIYRTR